MKAIVVREFGEPDYIEAHHTTPPRDFTGSAETKVSDLAMVCANCHRMLHRGNPWPTLGELRQRREKATAGAKPMPLAAFGQRGE